MRACRPRGRDVVGVMIATDLPRNSADYRARSWIWPSEDARARRLTGEAGSGGAGGVHGGRLHGAPPVRQAALADAVRPRGSPGSPGELAAAAGSAAAAATAAAARSRCRSGPAADGDRRQQLDGVVVALRAGRGVGRLAHRPGLLEGVPAGPASVLVSWHGLIVCRRAPWPLLPGRAAPATPVPRGAPPWTRGTRNPDRGRPETSSALRRMGPGFLARSGLGAGQRFVSCAWALAVRIVPRYRRTKRTAKCMRSTDTRD